MTDAPAPEVALVALASGSSNPIVLLHSAGGKPCHFSILGFDPLEPVRLQGQPESTWEALDRLFLGLSSFKPEAGSDPIPGPFHGGFLGALSYDLLAPGAQLDLPQDLEPEPFSQPLVVGGIYTDFLVWDHLASTCHLVLNRGNAARSSEILKRLSKAYPLAAPRSTGFHRETSAKEHCEHVDAVRAEIKAGEIYQANLSHRLVGKLRGTPEMTYSALVAANPVPYAGYVRWPGGALLSASPELLVECDPKDQVLRRARTRPIKGTAPRSSDPEEDAALAKALLASEKDRAELAMIVDLERNDLARIARSSVTVDAMARLERYASVQHLVSDVSAEMRPGVSTLELLAALFPGGSITGAPKLRSMEIIAGIEGAGRGFFTGSLGFVDSRGAASFNILIRSLLWRDGTGTDPVADVSLRVGGGITWASDARAEDAETLHKAASLFAGLGAKLHQTE